MARNTRTREARLATGKPNRPPRDACTSDDRHLDIGPRAKWWRWIKLIVKNLLRLYPRNLNRWCRPRECARSGTRHVDTIRVLSAVSTSFSSSKSMRRRTDQRPTSRPTMIATSPAMIAQEIHSGGPGRPHSRYGGTPPSLRTFGRGSGRAMVRSGVLRRLVVRQRAPHSRSNTRLFRNAGCSRDTWRRGQSLPVHHIFVRADHCYRTCGQQEIHRSRLRRSRKSDRFRAESVAGIQCLRSAEAATAAVAFLCWLLLARRTRIARSREKRSIAS